MKTILLVEGNPNQRELYEELLAESGYDAVSASNGEEAVLAVIATSPDLIVLGVGASREESAEALSRLLAIKPGTPAILNAAHMAWKDDFLSGVAKACLLKSSDTSELTKTIDRLLESAAPNR